MSYIDISTIEAAIASTVRKTSGLTPVATTTDAVETAIAADGSNDFHQVVLANEGTVAGFYSIDGGTTWHRLPSEHVTKVSGVLVSNVAIQIKRIAGGSNLSGVYVEGF